MLMLPNLMMSSTGALAAGLLLSRAQLLTKRPIKKRKKHSDKRDPDPLPARP